MTDAAGTAPLPAFAELRAPPTWRAVDLLSDLHLADDTPATLAAFESHLAATDADAVIVLGDLFEVFVGDDAREAGSAEARVCAALAACAARRATFFMAGNRDFLVRDATLAACGMTALADPTVLAIFGARIVLTHGDALCITDTAYQQFRATVRGAAWQRAFLARPLAERRAVARGLRDASEARKRAQPPADWADADSGLARRWAQAAGASVLIHGHTHRPGDDTLAPGITRHVLSDWDLDHATPPRAEVLRVGADGIRRIAPAGAPLLRR